MWTDKHGVHHPFNPTNDDMRDGLAAKDSTDCLASGRIEIRSTAEKLQAMKVAASILMDAVDNFDTARNELDNAQAYYDETQTALAEAQEAMQGFFA